MPRKVIMKIDILFLLLIWSIYIYIVSFDRKKLEIEKKKNSKIPMVFNTQKKIGKWKKKEAKKQYRIWVLKTMGIFQFFFFSILNYLVINLKVIQCYNMYE